MPRGVPLAWPADKELREILRASDSMTDAARRMGVNRERLRDYLMFKGDDWPTLTKNRNPERITAKPVEPVEDPRRLRIDQQGAEIKMLRKENDDYRKALASQERFFDRLVEAARVPVKVPKYSAPKLDRRKHRRSVVLPIYDCQFGQFVRPADTPGNLGGFSVEIFDQRLKRYVEGVCSILAQYATAYTIEELVIPFGGDQVEGDEIFAGQPWQLELDPPRQVWELASRFDAALRVIVGFVKTELGVPHVAAYGVTGNHGRVGGKRGGARPATYNWDWLFLKILFDRLRAEPITTAIESGGALFFSCAGHQFQMIHGDQIRGWGGLPFYGLTKFDGRSIRLHSTIYRYLLMGHHHQPGEIPNGSGETIVSGDWVGANNLSGMITAASRPQQKVLFVAEKWGVTGTERVYFTEADQAYSQPTIYGKGAA